jgi:DNA-directed RNA polymerase subunit RPC12/RpoP
VAAGPEVEEAGEVVPCPKCGTEVKLHSMIPILAEGGEGKHTYLCVNCARALVEEPV